MPMIALPGAGGKTGMVSRFPLPYIPREGDRARGAATYPRDGADANGPRNTAGRWAGFLVRGSASGLQVKVLRLFARGDRVGQAGRLRVGVLLGGEDVLLLLLLLLALFWGR